LYDTLEAVQLLLKHGENINGSSKFAAAANRGKVKTVKHLLDLGADPNYGWSRPIPFLPTLRYRTDTGRDIVWLLVEHGGDSHIKDVEARRL
jgi:hypothetical protein